MRPCRLTQLERVLIPDLPPSRAGRVGTLLLFALGATGATSFLTAGGRWPLLVGVVAGATTQFGLARLSGERTAVRVVRRIARAAAYRASDRLSYPATP